MKFEDFKSQALQLLADELTAWGNGSKQWNVSNQFDESIVESAFDNLSYEKPQAFEAYARFNAELPSNIMDLAHMVSTFDVEPLADGWTQ